MQHIWTQVLEDLQASLPASPYARWIRPITLLECRDDAIVLGFADQFSLDWTKEYYLARISEKVEEKAQRRVDVRLRVHAGEGETKPPPCAVPTPLPVRTAPNPTEKGKHFRVAINPRFTFDEFIVGPENRLAFEAARAMVRPDYRELYNPLFLSGDVGTGKTHLASAIVNHLRHQNPAMTTHYISAEAYFNEMVSSMRSDRLAPFKDKYRKQCDALVIDDVQYFKGKEKTQLELFHTFDALYHQGKMITFVGSERPKDISGMGEALRSRLGSGLVVQLHPPSRETRRAILIKKAKQHRLTLPEDVLEYLTEATGPNVRTIEAVLKRIVALSTLLKQPIDLDLAKNALTHIRNLSPRITNIREIRTLVTKYFQLSPDEIGSPSRKVRIVYPRQVAMYLCRRHTEESLEAIGKAFNRNHASVLHSVKVIDKKLSQHRKTRNHINFFLEEINKSGR